MSVSTFSVSYTHTVTHVTNKMLLTLKEIIREIGLDPSKLTGHWDTYEAGIKAWLQSRHLKRVTLEVYDPKKPDDLVTAWEINVVYDTVGDGALWVDTSAIRYAIAKAGVAPSSCSYEIKLKTDPGAPHVANWGDCVARSKDGFRRYAIGATLGGTGITAETAYWSR